LNSTAEIRADLAAPDSDNAAVNVVDVPILLMAKSASRESATLGETVTFSVSYQNGGHAALTAVTVVDTLPEGLQAIAASHGGKVSADGALVTWTLPDIGPGMAGAVTVDAQVSRIVTDVVTNVATLSSAELPDEQAAAALSISQPSVPVPIDQRWLWLMGALLGALAARHRLITRTAF
jgi:uncharacterized repeat protein (TIGR01451 family)